MISYVDPYPIGKKIAEENNFFPNQKYETLNEMLKNENFSTIKPLITIDKNSIFEESIKDLPDSKNIIAIFNKNIFEKYSILKKNFKKK